MPSFAFLSKIADYLASSYLIIVFIAVLCLVCAAPVLLAVNAWGAGSAGYHQYETDSGTIAFTDDPDQVPARYVDAKRVAVKSWADLKTKMDAKTTVGPKTHAVPTWSDSGEPEVNPNHLNDCTGHITVTDERFQIGEHNVVRVVARDECGKVVSITVDPPDIQFRR